MFANAQSHTLKKRLGEMKNEVIIAIENQNT